MMPKSSTCEKTHIQKRIGPRDIEGDCRCDISKFIKLTRIMSSFFALFKAKMLVDH